MDALWRAVRAAPARLYHLFVRSHLERLYFDGPSCMGVGFWAGQAPTDICAQLTSFASDFWTAHPAECDLIVRQHLRTFVVSVETALYSVVLYRCISGYVTHLAFVRPILHELRQLRAERAELRIEGRPAPRAPPGDG